MAGLEGTVKIPVVGSVPKKEAAIGAVVVGTLVVVYYVRHRSSSSSSATTAAAAASSTDQYPPDGTTGNPQDPYSTDPATGQTYGNEAVGSGGSYGAYGGLGAGATDAYPWDGTYGNSSDPYSMDPSSGVTYGDEGSAGNVPSSSGSGSGGPPFANNPAWSNYVLSQEQALDPGANIGDWQTALGLYLQGQPVSPAQKTIIFDAIAIAGDPPDRGSNGYPPNVKTNGSKGGHQPGPAVNVKVPDVTGQRAENAREALRDAGLTYNISDTQTGSVTGQSPHGGTSVKKGSKVRLTLKPDPVRGNPGPAGKK